MNQCSVCVRASHLLLSFFLLPCISAIHVGHRAQVVDDKSGDEWLFVPAFQGLGVHRNGPKNREARHTGRSLFEKRGTRVSPQMSGDSVPLGDGTSSMESGEPAPPPLDYLEDDLRSLLEGEVAAMEGSPMSEMAQFEVNETAEALAPLLSYTNSMAVEEAKEKFKLHENDTGSAQVQIAILSARIQYMTKHMQENKKDYSSLRGLTAMVTRRRKLLEYLLREDVPEFMRITSELGIRTNQLLKPKLQGARSRRA